MRNEVKMTVYRPRHEEKTGANCSGLNGETGRTYALSYTGSITSQFSVILAGAPLQMNVDYTLSDDLITFLFAVFNIQEITIDYLTVSRGSTPLGDGLSYTTVLGLVRHLNALSTVPNMSNTTNEVVGVGDNSTTKFWLDHIGVLDDNYTLYYGATPASITALTDVVHYTLDLETSEITLTATGKTTVGTNSIYARYKYNIFELSNDQLLRALQASENDMENMTDQVFADGTSLNPQYASIVNETAYCSLFYNPMRADKVYDVTTPPIVELATTVNGAYTTGGVTLTLADSSGFPVAGTIYIGGNRVSYTAKSGNNITVPATTPSIATGATVRGEIIELSREPEGNEPSYLVLDPDIEYQVDYHMGRIRLLDNAFYGELNADLLRFPESGIARFTYQSAWHDLETDPVIPDAILECIYMMASKKLVQRMIKRAHIGGTDSFNPAALSSGDDEIDDIIMEYKQLNVGTSPYNRKNLS